MSRLFMKVYLDKEGGLAGLNKLVSQALSEGAKSLLILAAEGCPVTEGEYNTTLKSIKIPVFGGIFPRIIYQNECLAVGHLVCSLHYEPEVVVIDKLSANSEGLDHKLAQQLTSRSGSNSFFLFFSNLLILIIFNNCIIR